MLKFVGESFFVLSIFCGLWASGSQVQCPSFYLSNNKDVTKKIDSLQAQLIQSAQSPSIQSTVAAEYYIRSLRDLLDIADFRVQDSTADVNAFSFRVSELSQRISSNETVLKRIDQIKKKIKILKDKKVPALVSIRGQKDAYLNSVALDIKRDFAVIKEESNVSESNKEIMDSVADDVLVYTLGLENKLGSFQRYQTTLADTIVTLQNHSSSGLSPESVQSLSMVLNQIMLESNLAFQNVSLIKEAIKSLKSQSSALLAVKNTANTISQIELSVFLMETGLSPSFIETEVSLRASKLEEKSKQAAEKAAAKQASKVSRKEWFNTNIMKIMVYGAISGGLGTAGYYQAKPTIDVYQLGFRNAQVEQTIKQSKDLTWDAGFDFLHDSLPRFEDQLSVKDFLTYMAQRKPHPYYVDRYARMINTAKAFFLKRIKTLTYEEVVEIGDRYPTLKDSFVTSFLEYKRSGKVPSSTNIKTDN